MDPLVSHGFDRVPYFYNLNMLNGIPTEVKNSIKVDKKIKLPLNTNVRKPNWGGVESDRCGDGILNGKAPRSQKKGVNYDNYGQVYIMDIKVDVMEHINMIYKL